MLQSRLYAQLQKLNHVFFDARFFVSCKIDARFFVSWGIHAGLEKSAGAAPCPGAAGAVGAAPCPGAAGAFDARFFVSWGIHAGLAKSLRIDIHLRARPRHAHACVAHFLSGRRLFLPPPLPDWGASPSDSLSSSSLNLASHLTIGPSCECWGATLM